MICSECGTRLPTGKIDCHFCGHLNVGDVIQKKQEDIIGKLTEISDKQEKISDRQAESSSSDSSNFIDKFIALFALLALFVTLIVFFSGYIEIYAKNFIQDAQLRALISIAIAAMTTFFFWLLSPLMIRNLIESQKPFAGNIWEIFILIGVYFILVVVNFEVIPIGISLVTFIVLTILFVGFYQYLSQNSIIFKK